MTSKKAILLCLTQYKKVLAGHEFRLVWNKNNIANFEWSDNNICTRLNELEREGYIYQGKKYYLKSNLAVGKNYKIWWIDRILDLPKEEIELKQDLLI